MVSALANNGVCSVDSSSVTCCYIQCELLHQHHYTGYSQWRPPWKLFCLFAVLALLTILGTHLQGSGNRQVKY